MLHELNFLDPGTSNKTSNFRLSWSLQLRSPFQQHGTRWKIQGRLPLSLELVSIGYVLVDLLQASQRRYSGHSGTPIATTCFCYAPPTCVGISSRNTKRLRLPVAIQHLLVEPQACIKTRQNASTNTSPSSLLPFYFSLSLLSRQ